jgi:agmatinase
MPTRLPDPRRTPRFAGVSTFCRYPLLESLAPSDAAALNWLVYGVPHDTGVTFRPGARFAPRAIRDASQYVKRYHIVHDVDVCEALSIADAGDAPVNPYDLPACIQGIAQWAGALPNPTTTRLFAVGGEHTIAYANMRATRERLMASSDAKTRDSVRNGLALIHFDAHLDTVDAVWGGKWGHASPFRRAIEDGVVDPRAMLSIGIRGPLNSVSDLEYAKSQGVRVVSAEAVIEDEGSARGTFLEFVRELDGRPAYITFDVDVLDPAFAPGTGTPCPGGLNTAQAFGLLRRLRGVNVVGGDVVEVLPDRDHADITATFAAHVIFEVLALDAVRRKGASA